MLLENIKTTDKQNIPQPHDSIVATNEYINDNNPVKTYIDNYILRHEDKKIKASELKEHYDTVMETPISLKIFYKQMKSNGYATVFVRGIKYYKDVIINTDMHALED
jgi:hypothetical protein